MQRFLQLALDFLGGPDPLPVPAPPAVRPAPDEHAPPALPMDDVFQPATWHHPRANRQIRLRQCHVAYEFKRARRRTIGLSVGQDGLTVSAPRWTPVAEVEALLLDRADWVLEKLQAARERRTTLDQARIGWADGATFEVLGQPVQLLLDPTHAYGSRSSRHAQFEASDTPGAPAVLRLGLPHTATEAQIRDAAQAWLMRRAEAVFTERLQHFAPQLGVQWSRLRLSSAGTRWGSATADGTIRLNWRLIFLSMDMVDYVVVHELSHLRHMDHSPRFWDVVASVMPDHRERRQALRQVAVPPDA